MAIVTQNDVAYQAGQNSNLLVVTQKVALERLASIDLIELSNEAKIERCRATRDLRSCGRFVQYMLTSCGHASLCAECSQRCDLCPICRVRLPQNGNRIRLRLYYECMEAGLISKVHNDRFQENDDGENQLAVQRLYALFDVAMENNLVSLICHYITDVCMDETAVSSDPVMSFLLDEVVIKDWCKRAFGSIKADLRQIYALEVEEMKTRMSSLLRLSSQLTGISNVLEVLESSIKGTSSAQHDLHCLQENVLKAKQHSEIMMWCISHQFAENIRSRYPNHESWESLFRQRKAAAIKRSWPDLITSIPANTAQQNGGSLFIEDALSNLEIEQEYGQELEVASLAKDGSTSFSTFTIKGLAGCYPFENVRSAIDILFLCGSSDMVVAKQAIFLYYLFDRHWTTPDAQWKCIIDDFAASFIINRHSLLESLIFYLLDDHADEALQEACGLLPEISGPATHPKIAQVLLERQNPDAALMVLRWFGLDGLCAYANSEQGRTQLVSLRDAVTAVRARVECGLLTEAFMYQRTHHQKAKEDNVKRGSFQMFSNDFNGDHETWVHRMEALVTEICCLCIRRNLVDRMIELPWNSDEEKYIHKRLFDYASEDPSAPFGSLLVVYYLQRFRYIEAYQVDRKLQSLEQDCLSKGSTSEDIISRILSNSQKRVALVDKCIELLPKAQLEKVKKSGNFDISFSPGTEVASVSNSNLAEAHSPNTTSLLPPLLLDSSRVKSTVLSKKTPFETPPRLGGYMTNSYSEPRKSSPHIPPGRFLTTDRSSPSHTDSFVSKQFGIRDNFAVDNFSTPGIHGNSPQTIKPPKESNRSSSRVLRSKKIQDNIFDRVHPTGREPDLFAYQTENNQNIHLPYPGTSPINQTSTHHNDHRQPRDSLQDLHTRFSGEQYPSDVPLMGIPGNDSMDYSWSNENGASAVVDMNMNGGLRWRSE